jgi:hypothetical protein
MDVAKCIYKSYLSTKKICTGCDAVKFMETLLLFLYPQSSIVKNESLSLMIRDTKLCDDCCVIEDSPHTMLSSIPNFYDVILYAPISDNIGNTI